MKAKESKLIDKLLKSGEITINPELEKLQNVVLFPEKLEMANQFLKKHGLPKQYHEKITKQNKEKK